MHMERNVNECRAFGRVKNRIDLVGVVTKMDKRFVCLKIPDFKGCLEYPSNIVEIIEESNLISVKQS